AWQSRASQLLQPVSAGAGSEMRRENFLQVGMMRGTIGVARESRFVLQLGHINRVAHALPDRFIAGARHEESIASAELLKRRDRRMPRANRPGHLARDREARDR